MNRRNSFYLTTAIDYPNGTPHMGHAYEKIVTDAYARWYRLQGFDVWFLTGTDENGQKLAKAAIEAGQDPQSFVDANVEHFRSLCRNLNISNDDFIRTTEERHIAATKDLWQRLEKAGDIYFDRYSGHYCYGCEAFYPKTQAPDLKCPNHGTALEFVEEEGYFFRLSKYESWIRSYLEEHTQFIVPSSARSEMLGRLRADELRDLSISRPNQGWGIPVPGRTDHVIYTWFDALINYWAAVHYGQHKNPAYWPCDMHVIGKDITWFHSVIWPCMLHAAGIEPPHQVWVHGMVLAEDGRKMSKSLGNGIDPNEMIQKYGTDAFRYYLLRAIAAGQDGAFSEADLRTRYNNELANVYGNTFQRVIKFTLKKFGKELSPPANYTPALDMQKIYDRMVTAMDDREHNRALDALWDGLNEVNAYLNANEPWRIKDDDAKVQRIVYDSLHAMHALGALVSAFMPETGNKTLTLLGTGTMPISQRFLPTTFKFGEPEALFPRLE